MAGLLSALGHERRTRAPTPARPPRCSARPCPSRRHRDRPLAKALQPLLQLLLAGLYRLQLTGSTSQSFAWRRGPPRPQSWTARRHRPAGTWSCRRWSSRPARDWTNRGFLAHPLLDHDRAGDAETAVLGHHAEVAAGRQDADAAIGADVGGDDGDGRNLLRATFEDRAHGLGDGDLAGRALVQAHAAAFDITTQGTPSRAAALKGR